MKLWILFFTLVSILPLQAQNAADEIDFSKIPQRTIRTLIQQQFDQKQLQHFNELNATYYAGQNLHGYRKTESVYYLRETPDNVWKTYQATSPAASWNGKMVSFGVLLSKWNDSILYRNDAHFAGIDTGQVFFINLRIMKGLYNLAVGLEIVNIDPSQRSITFSYLEGGKSKGEQTIYFVPTKKGHTRIVHQTNFKSNSYLRDCYLYPYFHRIAINEFHRNMKKSVMVSIHELALK